MRQGLTEEAPAGGSVRSRRGASKEGGRELAARGANPRIRGVLGQSFEKNEHVVRREGGEIVFADVVDDSGEVTALGHVPIVHPRERGGGQVFLAAW
jgi:hypothetical protein